MFTSESNELKQIQILFQYIGLFASHQDHHHQIFLKVHQKQVAIHFHHIAHIFDCEFVANSHHAHQTQPHQPHE